MARSIWQKTITDEQGNIQEGVQITVNIQGGGLADITANQSGSVSKDNPFQTGADGVAKFFAEPGFYEVTAFKNGESVIFDWNNVGDNRLREDLAAADSDVLIAGFPARNFNDKINELDSDFDAALVGYQGEVDDFLLNNQTSIDRINTYQKLVDNAVVRLKFDTDEGHQHNDLSVTRGNATSLINYTCPTTATGQTADGRIVEVAPNTPRIVWNNGEAVGLLNEPSSENLWLWSEDFTKSEWALSNGVSVISETESSPIDGSLAAELSDGANDGTKSIAQSAPVTEGTVYTKSVFAKSSTLTNVIISVTANAIQSFAYLNFNTDSGNLVGESNIELIDSYGAIKLKDGWWRFYVTFTATKTGTEIEAFRLANSNTSTGNYTGASESLKVIGSNFTAGYLTSYIPTTILRVVRGGSLSYVEPVNITPTSLTSFVEFYIEDTDAITESLNYVIQFNEGESTSSFLGINLRPARKADLKAVGVEVLTFSSAFENGLNRMCFVIDGGTGYLYSNGVLLGSVTGIPDLTGTLTRLNIGGNLNVSLPFSCPFSHQVTANIKLSQSEAIALTTLEPEA